MQTLKALLFGVLATSLLAVSAQHANIGASQELSHGGGTDKCGCHYNRKTGEYHCHKRKKRGGDCPP